MDMQRKGMLMPLLGVFGARLLLSFLAVPGNLTITLHQIPLIGASTFLFAAYPFTSLHPVLWVDPFIGLPIFCVFQYCLCQVIFLHLKPDMSGIEVIPLTIAIDVHGRAGLDVAHRQ